MINPKTPPKQKDRWFRLRAIRLILKHGFNNLKQWVAEGQYEDPKAIQFGGFELQSGPEILLSWLDDKLNEIKRIWAIDLHTGLGLVAMIHYWFLQIWMNMKETT